MCKKLLLLVIVLLCSHYVHAQVAVKTNLLYDATTTPNFGLEYGFKQKNSIQLVYGINLWTFNSESKGERKVKHWMVMPEYRRWFCTAMNGWFVGVHGLGGQFNAGNVDLPLPGSFFKGENLRTGVRDSRYEGMFLGGGITVGYQWILARHWNLEAEVGAGYAHAWYDKYPCAECGTRLDKGQTNYFGVTKLGLSIMYVF